MLVTMRARSVGGRWIVALVCFVVILAGGLAALGALHPHWPVWVVPVVAAVGGVLVGFGKPVLDSLAKLPVARVEQAQRAKGLVADVTGPGNPLPRVADTVGRGLLGIHPAIPLPDGADPELSPELPQYVLRDIDATLRTWFTAHTGQGGFALVVGAPAAGKTRCVYEAVKATVPDWHLLMPPSGRHLVDLVDADTDLSRTVVWLNDIHTFLGSDGVSARTVRRLLADTGRPVLIVGTVWPDQYDALTFDETEGAGMGSDGREILGMLATRFDLPSEFSADEITRAKLVSAADPRIAEAVNGGATIAETLAAAPELVRRWRYGNNPYGRAVITAALTARRCGHPEPIPTSVLEPVADHCLTPEQRAQASEDWFAAALTWARKPVRGSAAPLTPLAERVGAIDGDHVSDVLVPHATSPITEAVWELVIGRAKPEVCAEIGAAAHGMLLSVAERAFMKSADSGDPRGMNGLGVVARARGDEEAAERSYRKAVLADSVVAMINLGALLHRHGDTDEAERWFRRAAEAGDTRGMVSIGAVLAAKGSTAEEEVWYRRAADAGDAMGMNNLGAVLFARGDVVGAESLFRSAAEAGDGTAMSNLGRMMRDRGALDEAESWFRKSADAAMSGAGSAWKRC
jgi:Flp pilus assembly protein TadD